MGRTIIHHSAYPTAPEDLSENSELGRLWSTYQHHYEMYQQMTRQASDWDERLRECQRIVDEATPWSDMVQVAAALAEITVLERYLAANKRERAVLADSAAEARQEWERVWAEYQRLLDDAERYTARGQDMPERLRQRVNALVR